MDIFKKKKTIVSHSSNVKNPGSDLKKKVFFFTKDLSFFYHMHLIFITTFVRKGSK